MKFKYLLISLLIAISLIILVSCKHEHEFESWTTTKAATCTENGTQEGICEKCGEKDVQEIPASHIWEKGVECGAEQRCTRCDATRTNPAKHILNYSTNTCKNCNKPKVSIKFPELPLTVHRYDSNGNIKETFDVTSLEYELTANGVTIFWGGEKVAGANNNTVSTETYIYFKLYDADSYVIESGFSNTPSIGAGEKVRNQSFVLTKIRDWEEYSLEIKSVSEKEPGTN